MSLFVTTAIAATKAVGIAADNETPSSLGSTEWFIPSTLAEGHKLYVRARGPRGRTPLVLVHGFFQPASAILDVPCYSMQQTLAAQGFRVYLFDFRGYGLSSRPPFMDQPAAESTPSLGCMSDAVADLEDVVRFVLHEEGAKQVDLLGYSWGTARSVNYALSHAGLVRKLVLYAPVWKPSTGAAGDAHNPAAPGQMNPKHGGYVLFKPGDLARNWDWEIDKENAGRFRSPEALAAAEQALMASDDFNAWGGFRAPLGPMVDALAVTQGSALFDAKQIGCDTLMLRGTQDRLSSELDATSLLNAVGAQNKRLVTFETGTHLLHLEHARDHLINEVSAFLVEQ